MQALLRQVQQAVAPKVAPEALELFFRNNGIQDKEDLAAMLDEPALMKCGIPRAASRVAIARITTRILSPPAKSAPTPVGVPCVTSGEELYGPGPSRAAEPRRSAQEWKMSDEKWVAEIEAQVVKERRDERDEWRAAKAAEEQRAGACRTAEQPKRPAETRAVAHSGAAEQFAVSGDGNIAASQDAQPLRGLENCTREAPETDLTAFRMYRAAEERKRAAAAAVAAASAVVCSGDELYGPGPASTAGESNAAAANATAAERRVAAADAEAAERRVVTEARFGTPPVRRVASWQVMAPSPAASPTAINRTIPVSSTTQQTNQAHQQSDQQAPPAAAPNLQLSRNASAPNVAQRNDNAPASISPSRQLSSAHRAASEGCLILREQQSNDRPIKATKKGVFNLLRDLPPESFDHVLSFLPFEHVFTVVTATECSISEEKMAAWIKFLERGAIQLNVDQFIKHGSKGVLAQKWKDYMRASMDSSGFTGSERSQKTIQAVWDYNRPLVFESILENIMFQIK